MCWSPHAQADIRCRSADEYMAGRSGYYVTEGVGGGRGNGGKSEEKEGRKVRKNAGRAQEKKVEMQVQKDRLPRTGGCQGDIGTKRKGLPWPGKVSQATLFC